MWNKLKASFFLNIILPVYTFWEWLFGSKNKKIPNIIKRNTKKEQKAKEPPRSWPYADRTIDRGPVKKMIYHRNAKHLESRLSRNFRQKKQN